MSDVYRCSIMRLCWCGVARVCVCRWTKDKYNLCEFVDFEGFFFKFYMYYLINSMDKAVEIGKKLRRFDSRRLSDDC